MFPDWFIIAGYILAALTIGHIVLQRREPTATLAWVLGVALVPYVGILAYLLFGRQRLYRHVRRRKAHATVLESSLQRYEEEVAPLRALISQEMVADRPHAREILRLTNRIGCRSPTMGNHVHLLPDANQAYSAMEAALVAAKRQIHFQFYIFQPDETGRRFRDLLTQKAKEGLEVRVLVDAVGSYRIAEFLTPLIQAGGHFAEFLPLRPVRRLPWNIHLRNHRKIVIIDGCTAFTGGVNIGDEYTGRKKRVGPWRDTHTQIDGPAAHHLQEVFAEDWFFATGEDLDTGAWFPEQKAIGDMIVQVVASGPDTDTQPIQRIFFTAVTSARQRVFLTTPYFVPDQAMLFALETAAMRGVDVRLLLPAKSDLRLVHYAGRSYYDQLLETGVRIFEYQPAVLHSKTLVVDDHWATIGSSNMDIRSFRLNFEVNAIVYGNAFARELTRVFETDLNQAKEITSSDNLERRKNIRQRFAESLARTLSPLL